MNHPSVIKTLRNFSSYAKYIWPIHRIWAKKHVAMRCSKCILSENYTKIMNDGVCQICHEEANQTVNSNIDENDKMKLEFNNFMNSFENKGKGYYDALVLFSGGKDSSFLIYKLKKDFRNLRILAVTVDNGFLSPIGLNNAKEIINKLDVDYFYYKPNKELFIKAFQFAFNNLNGQTCTKMIDELDGRLIFDIGQNLAASMQIPLLIRGTSYGQIMKTDTLRSYLSPPADPCYKKRKTVSEMSLESIYGHNSDIYQWWWDPNRYSECYIPKVISPYYVWRLHEEDIKKAVIDLKLIIHGNESPLITNSPLILLEAVIDVLKYGYCGFEAEFARMIRQGKSDRNFWLNIFEALEFCSKKDLILKKTVDNLANQLNLDIKSIISNG